MFSCKSGAVKNTNSTNETLMTCTIFQTGVYWEVYTIEVYRNGNYKITLGEKEINKPESDFIKITKQDSLILNKVDYQVLEDLCDEISLLDELEKKSIKKGGWEIMLNIEGKRFNFYNGEQSDTAIDKAIQKLKQLSPIEIDLHWR